MSARNDCDGAAPRGEARMNRGHEQAFAALGGSRGVAVRYDDAREAQDCQQGQVGAGQQASNARPGRRPGPDSVSSRCLPAGDTRGRPPRSPRPVGRAAGSPSTRGGGAPQPNANAPAPSPLCVGAHKERPYARRHGLATVPYTVVVVRPRPRRWSGHEAARAHRTPAPARAATGHCGEGGPHVFELRRDPSSRRARARHQDRTGRHELRRRVVRGDRRVRTSRGRTNSVRVEGAGVCCYEACGSRNNEATPAATGAVWRTRGGPSSPREGRRCRANRDDTNPAPAAGPHA